MRCAATIKIVAAHALQISLVDILIVNAIEAEMLGGAPVIETLNSAGRAARSLIELCSAVIVTTGGDGVAFADRRGQVIEIAAVKVRVESTHGAGDEFVGALAALACGQPIKSALHAATGPRLCLSELHWPRPRR